MCRDFGTGCVAGIYQPRRFEGTTREDFRLMLGVNLLGVFSAAQEGAIAFLVNPATRFITGQTLFVDGGKFLGGLGV